MLCPVIYRTYKVGQSGVETSTSISQALGLDAPTRTARFANSLLLHPLLSAGPA